VSRKVVLHIGLDKCGSTSIQRFLWMNREVLASSGFAVPAVLNWPSHPWLGVLAYKERRDCPVTARLARQLDMEFASDSEWAEMLRTIRKEFINWWRDQGDGTLLLSAEDLIARLDELEVGNVADLLGEETDDVKVLVYVRDPVSFTVSGWSQRVKSGDSRGMLDEDSIGGWSRRINAIKYWEKAFAGRVEVRLFDPHAFFAADLLQDYRRSAGIPQDLQLPSPPRTNESLSWRAMRLLLHINSRFPMLTKAGKLNAKRGNLGGAFTSYLPQSQRYVPSPNELSDLREASSEAMDWLVQTHLSHEAHLWRDVWTPIQDVDIDRNPELTDEETEIAQLVTRLWSSKTSLLSSHDLALVRNKVQGILEGEASVGLDLAEELLRILNLLDPADQDVEQVHEVVQEKLKDDSQSLSLVAEVVSERDAARAQVEVLETTLMNLREQLAQQASRLEALDAQRRDALQIVSEQQRARQDLVDQLIAVQRSRSWRWTRFLRWR